MKRLVPMLLVALLAGCDGPSAGEHDGEGPGGGSTAQGCPDDLALFEERLWEPVLQTKCLQCHNAQGAAASSRLVLTAEPGPLNEARNLAAIRALSKLEVNGAPLLVAKPTNTHPEGHGGGRVLLPGSGEAEALAFQVRWNRGEVKDCAVPQTLACDERRGRRLLRRLSHDEYRHTVRDLLGFEPDGLSLASDVEVHGFRNDADALTVSPLLADQYRTAAEALAGRAVDERLLQLTGCGGRPEGECAAAFVRDFGRRAFRRPLSAEEQRRYLAVYESSASEEGFSGGIRWILTAMLQSPHFLYRSELGARGSGGDFQLTPWELATELSDLFWQTMPDEQLFAAAASGALATPAGLRAEAERLAKDPRAIGPIAGFVDQWLKLDRLETVPRDATQYPALTPEIRTAMRGELTRFVSSMVEGDLGVPDALLARHSFMTDALAAYYGVAPGTGAADAEGFRRVDLTGTRYGGLLSLGGLLTTHALPTSSSPIHRGLLVRERLLCQPLPPPPPLVNASPPKMDPNKTTRERYAEHASSPACAACHDLMDPIGYGFEAFDGAGRFREMDGMHPVDDRGEVRASLSSDGAFQGLQGLSELLAQSEDVRQCVAKMFSTWALGFEDAPGLACAVADASRAGASFGELRAAVLESPHFRLRTGGPDELDAPGASLPPQGEDPGQVPDPVIPPVAGDGEVTLTVTDDSRWETGACHRAVVTNRTGADVIWSVPYDVQGTITQHWNVTPSGTSGRITFSGGDWNATLKAGTGTEFGFCTAF